MGEETPILPPEKEESEHDSPPCWPPGEAPEYLHVIFEGVILCPDFEWPNDVDLNRLWWLTSIDPWSWLYTDANWTIGYQAISEQDARITANPFGDWRSYFFRDREPNCTLFFVNGMQLPCQFTDGAYGGIANLTSPV